MLRILNTFLVSVFLFFITFNSNANTKKNYQAKSFLAIPATFEKNIGQTRAGFQYILRQANFNLLLTRDGAMLGLTHSTNDKTKKTGIGSDNSKPDIKQSYVKIKFLKANKSVAIKGVQSVKTLGHYFIGSDEKKWLTNAPHFKNVTYNNIYKGVDLTFFADKEKLQFDIDIAPGTNPNKIRFLIESDKAIKTDKQGNLIIGTNSGLISLSKPKAFQQTKKKIFQVKAGFKILKQVKSKKSFKSIVSFSVGKYDKSRPLIIDPVIAYSTILGGAETDLGNAIDVDAANHPYVLGFTRSIQNFPLNTIIQTENQGDGDIFVLKLDKDGSGIIYSTYLGGAGYDFPYSLALDADGNAHVSGSTRSIDNTNTPSVNEGFPLKNPLQANFGGGETDGFVAILDGKGSSLLYSSYFGGNGNDDATLALDDNSNIYISGSTKSTDLATSLNCIQPRHSNPELQELNNTDAYFAKFSRLGSSIVFSSYLGGRLTSERVEDISVDRNNNIHIVGQTFKLNGFTAPGDGLPLVNPIQENITGSQGFVAKLAEDCSNLIYATYFGGAESNIIHAIVTDTNGNAYIGGNTNLRSTAATHTFPLQNAFQQQYSGRQDSFVAKINPQGGLMFSSLLGGEGSEVLQGIDFNPNNGNIVVTGWTESRNFPVVNAIQPTYLGGEQDVFLTTINSNTNQIIFSSYLGGIGRDRARDVAVDNDNNIFITGDTRSLSILGSDLSQTTNSGTDDLFITRINEFDQSLNLKPDLLIKKGTQNNHEFAINDIYQRIPEGQQIATQSTNLGNPVSYQIKVDDDSVGNNFNVFFIKARESGNSGWAVTYRHKGEDISEQIKGPVGFRMRVGDGSISDSNTILTASIIEVTVTPSSSTATNQPLNDGRIIDPNELRDRIGSTRNPFISLLQKTVTIEVFIDSVDTRVFDSVKAVTNLSFR